MTLPTVATSSGANREHKNRFGISSFEGLRRKQIDLIRLVIQLGVNVHSASRPAIALGGTRETQS